MQQYVVTGKATRNSGFSDEVFVDALALFTASGVENPIEGLCLEAEQRERKSVRQPLKQKMSAPTKGNLSGKYYSCCDCCLQDPAGCNSGHSQRRIVVTHVAVETSFLYHDSDLPTYRPPCSPQ